VVKNAEDAAGKVRTIMRIVDGLQARMAGAAREACGV
jgi:polyphosphate kinase 2 (PPK2 family)